MDTKVACAVVPNPLSYSGASFSDIYFPLCNGMFCLSFIERCFFFNISCTVLIWKWSRVLFTHKIFLVLLNDHVPIWLRNETWPQWKVCPFTFVERKSSWLSMVTPQMQNRNIIQDTIFFSYTATGYLVISEGDITCKISEYKMKS